MSLNKEFYQYNYIEVLKKYIPQIYFEDEILLYGTEKKDLIFDFINKITTLANDFDTYVFNVSSYDSTAIRDFFINKNNLTKVTASVFQTDVLNPLKTSLTQNGFPTKIRDFVSSSQFQNALSSVILPNIHLNNPTDTFVQGASSYLFPEVSTQAAAHQHLINSLGVLYFINTSATQTTPEFQPSAGVSDLITDLIYTSGIGIELADCLKKLYRYLWFHTDQSIIFNSYVPAILNKSTSGSDGLTTSSYTSGTQHLDRIGTLIDIVYNKQDIESTVIETTLDTLIGQGFIPDTKEPSGPLYSLFKGLGCSLYDINVLIGDLEDLLDIERCPKDFFEYLAKYLGWRLRGQDLSSWRNQLRQAIYVYKSKGTIEALNNAMDHLFPSSIINPASALTESWESYIPFLLYYTISTESPVFSGDKQVVDEFFTFFQRLFQRLGLTPPRLPASIEKLRRLSVDYIIARIHSETKFLQYGGEEWEFKYVNDQGRTTLVPPFERDNYYRRITVDEDQLISIQNWLSAPVCSGGFEIDSSAVSSVISYIRNGTLDNETEFLGTHKTWKFFKTAIQYPFNRDLLISRGDADFLDFWCSKSSDVFVTLTASDYWVRSSPESTAWGSSAVDSMAETFIEFMPLHVVLNLRFLTEFSDTSGVMKHEGDMDCPAFEIYPRPTLDRNIPGASGIVLQNSFTGGHSLASGTGYVIANASGHNIDFPNKPLSALRSFNYIPPPSSTTWRGANISESLISDSDHNRYTARRKDLSYALPIQDVHFRNGESPPIAYQFLSASAVFDPVSAIQNVEDYIPLGFNFYKNNFEPLVSLGYAKNGYVVSQDRNGVWDTSVGAVPSAVINDITVSDTFPTRNSIQYCGSGLRDRSMLPAELYELWKINELTSASAVSSTNLIKFSSYESSSWQDFWIVSANGGSKVEKGIIDENKYAVKLTSQHWPTSLVSTTYPKVASVSQLVSGLEANTEYELTFDAYSIPTTSDLYLNNGIGVTAKQIIPNQSPTEYYNWVTEKFDFYNASGTKFSPNWAARKGEGERISYSVKFRAGDHPKDIYLEFWNMGSLAASSSNQALTNEVQSISNSIESTNYLTDISLKKVVSQKSLRKTDFGEAPHRLWHLYNDFEKALDSKVFDGGADFESHVFGPFLRGGALMEDWDASNVSSIDTVSQTTKGATPILSGKNLVPNGHFRDYYTSGGKLYPSSWNIPLDPGNKEVFLTSGDGPSAYNSPPSVTYINEGTGFIDDFWVTSNNIPLEKDDVLLSFAYWTADNGESTSGVPAIRINNFTKGFDYNFDQKDWHPQYGNVNNKKYLRLALDSIDNIASGSAGFWNYYKVIVKSSAIFDPSDTYVIFLLSDDRSHASNNTKTKFALMDMQSIEGWRTPQIFDNTYFDVYLNNLTSKKILFNQANNKLNFDFFEDKSLTFLGDGGRKSIDLVRKLEKEHYFKDSSYINVFDGSSVSGWSFGNTDHTHFNPYVFYLGEDGTYPTSAFDPSSLDFSSSPINHWSHGSLQFGRSQDSSAISPIFNLRPGVSATLSMPILLVSANPGGTGYPNLTWDLVNETKGTHFVVSDGSFSLTPLVEQTEDNGSHNFGTIQDVWKTHSVILPLRNNFDESDNFSLHLSANDSAADNSFSRTFVGPITIRNEINNRLEPDSSYELKFNRRTNSVQEDIGIALRIPEIDGVSWYFDFRRQKWVGLDPGDSNFPYKILKDRKYTTAFVEESVSFHTLNGRRTIPSFARAWADKNGPVNTVNREYEILIFRDSPSASKKISSVIISSDPYKGTECFDDINNNKLSTVVSIEKVTIINKTHENLLKTSNFVSGIESFDVIYNNIFDKQSDGFLSRDYPKSLQGKNGGNRASYIDQYGMDFDNDGKIDVSGATIAVSGKNTNKFTFEDI